MMHVGRASKVCPDMLVHGHKADTVSQAVYLGDIICQDGTNTSNIKDRVAKGMGQVNTIMHLLQTVSFGANYFQIALTLRETHLVSGTLSSSESWYGLKQREIEALEEVDKILLRKILNAPTSSCIESLYLELGIIPIRILIKARRINFNHYLVNLKKEEMLYKFFETQQKYPNKEDWTLQVAKDLKEFDIPESLEFIRGKSKTSFKKLVKKKMKEHALSYLLGLKLEHSKLDNLVYNKLKLQNYLKAKNIPVYEAKNLFKFRVRSAQFKENFGDRFEDKRCPLCLSHLDTQALSIQCDKVKEKIEIDGNYMDIFRENIPSNISKTLLRISKLRENTF